MPLLKEYRIVLPLTVEEFQRGREWHRVEKLRVDLKMLDLHKQEQNGQCTATLEDDTVRREPVAAIPFFHDQVEMPNLPGEYMLKQYGEIPTSVNGFTKFYNSVQSTLDVVVSDLMQSTEIQAWEAYPYFCSVSRNHNVGDSYETIIECICLPGNRTEENALKLPEKFLNQREIVDVDIAAKVDTDDYQNDKDPAIFKSVKTGRGPLKPGEWMQDMKPCMTCYVLVSIKCNLFGFGFGRYLERRLHRGIIRAMQLHHREIYCYIDEWFDATMADIKEQEKEVLTALKWTHTPNKEVSSNSCENENCGGHSAQSVDSTVHVKVEDSFFTKYFSMLACFSILLLALAMAFTPYIY